MQDIFVYCIWHFFLSFCIHKLWFISLYSSIHMAMHCIQENLLLVWKPFTLKHPLGFSWSVWMPSRVNQINWEGGFNFHCLLYTANKAQNKVKAFILTHCGQVTPYAEIELDQYQLRLRLSTIRWNQWEQFHMKYLSWITEISLNISYLKCH